MRKIGQIISNFLMDSKSIEISCDKYDVISFDIFDTLIKRRCGKSSNIFKLIQNKYFESTGKNLFDYYQQRIYAEREARSKNKGEIKLDDIYQILSSYYGNDISESLKDIEIKTEIEQCVGIEKNIHIYNKAINDKNKRVYIVSDMYLPMCIIKKILERNNIILPRKLYLSCNESKTKHKGDLFKLMILENNLSPQCILHIGDNFRNDVLMPRILGINVFPII